MEDLATNERLLPLEAQIVGAALERERESGRSIDIHYVRNSLGGVAKIIDQYFESILDGSSDRRVALKVLCAFSVRTRFRGQEDLSDVLNHLYEPPEDVREIVAYLLEQHLLVKHSPAKYELAHDYLAEFFNSKSGSELSPIDRDNIQFHMVGLATGNSNTLVPATVAEKRLDIGKLILIPLLSIMLIRLLHFGLPWTLVGIFPHNRSSATYSTQTTSPF